MDLTGRRHLVTGAASGIGRAVAVLLSQLGSAVLCADRDPEGLNETRGLLQGDGHATHVCDLKDLDAIATWLPAQAQTFGLLDGFVHAAGIPGRFPLRALAPDLWREVFLINTEVALALAKTFISRRVLSGERGSIVFISSVMARAGAPANAAYSLSKAALEGIARSLAVELAGRNIRVNCIAPGFVRTPMFEKMEKNWSPEQSAQIGVLHPLGLGAPEDVAAAAAFLLADTGKWVTGTVLTVDGGYLAQ